jgi:hypothetical protein
MPATRDLSDDSLVVVIGSATRRVMLANNLTQDSIGVSCLAASARAGWSNIRDRMSRGDP